VRLPDYIACANGRLSIDYRKWCAPARSRDEAMLERDESNPIARSSRSTHQSGVADARAHGRIDHHFVDGKTGEETNGQLA